MGKSPLPTSFVTETILNDKEILMRKFIALLTFLFIVSTVSVSVGHAGNGEESKIDVISNYVEEHFKELKVQGLSIGIIQNGKVQFLNYGYSDLEKRLETSEHTNYEIGSLTKSFTALAIMNLEKEGQLSLQDSVSKYFPDFYGIFNEKKQEITIEQLLHHTSGIGEDSIKLLREDASAKALPNLVDKIKGIKLEDIPGKQFEYATINYDILGAIIEKVSGKSYEGYIKSSILAPLQMNNSYVGVESNDQQLSKGFKISYFTPREYQSPIFRNNYPAGYLVSNTENMINWLQLQLGDTTTNIGPLVNSTHEADKTVSSVNNSFYGKGWFVASNRFDELYHGGMNPNFSSYISFSKKSNSGIVILANTNSDNFYEMSSNLSSFLYGDELKPLEKSSNKMDVVYSVFSIILFSLVALLICFCGYIVYGAKIGKRHRGFEKGSMKKLIINLMLLVPVLYGIYLFPFAFSGVDWYTAVVWSPSSFIIFVGSILTLLIFMYITYFMLLLFPSKNTYFKDAPEILTLGVIAGVCNAVVIFLITSALNGIGDLSYTVYYFVLALIIYISGRRTLEIKLVDVAQTIIESIRKKIFDRLFQISYEKFEKMESGRIIATITDDINRIGNLAGLAVVITTSFITIISAFIYLGTVSGLGTIISLLIIVMMAGIYAYFDSKAGKHLNVARETQNKFLSKVEGLIYGFKDISLHRTKKSEYWEEVREINAEYKSNNVYAFKMFVNAFMLGESLFIIVMGFIVFGFSFVFHLIDEHELTTFIMILLYLLGPINGILNAIPQLAQIRVAIDRVKSLLGQFPDMEHKDKPVILDYYEEIDSLSSSQLTFTYGNEETDGFTVGPIDFAINKGEILFIIGGNGSGKSTLIKLITGLYKPLTGSIRINNKEINQGIIGEYISSVFSDSHLFERFYNTDLSEKKEIIDDYLQLLELDKKVDVHHDTLSTVSLSTGQKKRLHLLRCYLEDKPIYIFDELAADQDPHFRKIFYRELLPQMKAEGKIVIAVTHDDHYFDVADKIFKLDMGRMDNISHQYNK